MFTSGLIKTFPYREQIAGVLEHELFHASQNPMDRRELGMWSTVGRQRQEEWSADWNAILQLDRKGVNPHGYISVLEGIKKRKNEKSRTCC